VKRKRRWGRIIIALIVLGGVIYGAWSLFRLRGESRLALWRGTSGRSHAAAPIANDAVDARAPAGQRIKIEVLNATTTKGLARRGTLFLRDRGFDVVGSGTTRPARDSTLVLDRSGHPEWARLVARALNARMESRPDSSRYLDVTVLLGGNWRPPALPFYP
jgi:fermentation-respiration switch protein FrsA (DUF1100 family)